MHTQVWPNATCTSLDDSLHFSDYTMDVTDGLRDRSPDRRLRMDCETLAQTTPSAQPSRDRRTPNGDEWRPSRAATSSGHGVATLLGPPHGRVERGGSAGVAAAFGCGRARRGEAAMSLWRHLHVLEGGLAPHCAAAEHKSSYGRCGIGEAYCRRDGRQLDIMV